MKVPRKEHQNSRTFPTATLDGLYQASNTQSFSPYAGGISSNNVHDYDLTDSFVKLEDQTWTPQTGFTDRKAKSSQQNGNTNTKHKFLNKTHRTRSKSPTKYKAVGQNRNLSLPIRLANRSHVDAGVPVSNNNRSIKENFKQNLFALSTEDTGISKRLGHNSWKSHREKSKELFRKVGAAPVKRTLPQNWSGFVEGSSKVEVATYDPHQYHKSARGSAPTPSLGVNNETSQTFLGEMASIDCTLHNPGEYSVSIVKLLLLLV